MVDLTGTQHTQKKNKYHWSEKKGGASFKHNEDDEAGTCDEDEEISVMEDEEEKALKVLK